jgi:hypothetical protein
MHAGQTREVLRGLNLVPQTVQQESLTFVSAAVVFVFAASMLLTNNIVESQAEVTGF